jgi:hypothetical protein
MAFSAHLFFSSTVQSNIHAATYVLSDHKKQYQVFGSIQKLSIPKFSNAFVPLCSLPIQGGNGISVCGLRGGIRYQIGSNPHNAKKQGSHAAVKNALDDVGFTNFQKNIIAGFFKKKFNNNICLKKD